MRPASRPGAPERKGAAPGAAQAPDTRVSL